MPLTDPQREILTELDEAKQALENATHQYNRMLRMVRDWDAGQGSILTAELTDAEVIALARTHLNAQRLLVITAAEAIPIIPGG